MGLNITVMSYLGRLDFGVVADREQMPDLWSLIGWLGDALEEIKPVGKPKQRRTPAATANGKRAKTKPAAEREGARSG